ncbi:MAG: hypothetical protein K0S25_1793, partial [Bacillus sp. (in: firmicutes)]|nr:hypothetical protein [Bacillus sp. (in: firmicutes)]
VLNHWDDFVQKFLKVIPKDFKRMMNQIEKKKEEGLSDEQAVMSAFEANVKGQKTSSSINLKQETIAK